MLRIVIALAAAALSSVVAAAPAEAPEAPPPAWEGVWQGTIGALPVRACLVHQDWGAFGAYYYLSHLQIIPLDGGKDGGTFREGDAEDAKAARWTIDSAGPQAIAGRWTMGARTLPLRLTRVAGVAADESPCASMAFHRPRLAGIAIVNKPAVLDGTAYTRLILDTRGRFDEARVETFQLDGKDDAVRRINARLRRPLAGDPPEWFQCIASAFETRGSGGGIDETIAPKLITPHWLSATDSTDSDCGGAHPNEDAVPLTFDRTTGREVDLHDWLNGKAVKRESFGSGTEEAKTLLPEFRRVVLGRWKPADSECADVVPDTDFWSIALTRTGLAFSPELAHAVQACADAFVIPFARLRPWLSAEGVKQVDAFVAEASRPR